MGLVFGVCPTCNAQPNEPCRTPAGRKRASVHDTRPMFATVESPVAEAQEFAKSRPVLLSVEENEGAIVLTFADGRSLWFTGDCGEAAMVEVKGAK